MKVRDWLLVISGCAVCCAQTAELQRHSHGSSSQAADIGKVPAAGHLVLAVVLPACVAAASSPAALMWQAACSTTGKLC